MYFFNKKIYFLILTLIVIVGIRVLQPYKNEKVLNFIAQHYYFDEDYYLEHYPEVKELDIKPLEHYVILGWKEGKNPNELFDTQLYTKLYPFNEKYNLNPLADYISSKLSFKKRIINKSQFAKITLLEKPKYYISLVALFQNEARFLKEWIEFYRLMGVEHFYLYNHLSSDNYMEILEPYIQEGVVELRHLKETVSNQREFNTLQTGTYNKLAQEVSDITEWLVIVDTDEFLFPVQEANLTKALSKYDEYASISVNWKMFGSGDVETIDSDKLMIESLFQSESEINSYIKNVVKPRYVDRISDPHFPYLKFPHTQITENFEHFIGSVSPEKNADILRINHYWSRDWKFFRETKLGRVHIAGYSLAEEQKKEKIEALINTNKRISTSYDGSILRFVKELRQRMYALPINSKK